MRARNNLSAALSVVKLLTAGVALAVSAQAQGAAACRPGATDDMLRPLPSSLVPQAERLFGLRDMPAEQVQRSTVVRCMDGRLPACTYGANLPCGKANTNRSLKGGDAWCRQHPESEFIPAAITGHDSIYRWSCSRGAAVATGPVEPVDARGFIARYWKRLQ